MDEEWLETARAKVAQSKRRRRNERGKTRMAAVLYTCMAVDEEMGVEMVMDAYEIRPMTEEEWRNA